MIADSPAALCSVEGCDRSFVARGLCMRHYQRLRSYGRLELLPKKPPRDTAAYLRAWHAAHPTYRLEKTRAWRAANPDIKKARDAAWRDANRELIRERHRAWMKAHPDRVRDNTARQRARRKPVLVIGRVNRQEVWERDKGMCGVCSQPADSTWQVDHIVPISNGGTHTMDNVQVAHKVCNQRKGAR